MADDVRRAIDDLEAALGTNLDYPEARAVERRAPGKWSRKEILGHLIDSAANNLQRFIRAQLADELAFPGYEQERWVALQDWHGAAWADLLALWRALNTQVIRVMERVPAERFGTKVTIGSNAPVTLGWLMIDYVRHVRHHLAQIDELPGKLALCDLLKPWQALPDVERETALAVLRDEAKAILEENVRPNGTLGEVTVEVIAASEADGRLVVHIVLDGVVHVTGGAAEHWMQHVWVGAVTFAAGCLRDGFRAARNRKQSAYHGHERRVEQGEEKGYDWSLLRRTVRTLKENELRGIPYEPTITL